MLGDITEKIVCESRVYVLTDFKALNVVELASKVHLLAQIRLLDVIDLLLDAPFKAIYVKKLFF